VKGCLSFCQVKLGVITPDGVALTGKNRKNKSMGIFSSKKQVEELKTALIGSYVFSKLKDGDQIEAIFFRLYTRLHEGGCDDPEEKFGTSPAIVQGGLFADVMIELNVPHGVSGFSWTFIPNPFALTVYSQKAQLKALDAIRKLGIDPIKECFPKQPEDTKLFVEEEYDDNLADGISHGQGAMTYTNGDKYEGTWKDGEHHGQGIETSAYGAKYVGEWKDGNRHGQGKYAYSNGDKYEGKFKDDRKHGQGTMIFGSGSKYEGEWKEGKKHGQGTYAGASGNKYVGEWENDKMHGQGIATWASGSKYEGEWKEGKKHGQGIHTGAGDNNYEGKWKDGSFISKSKLEPTSIENKEQLCLFAKKPPDRFSLESSLASLIDSLDLDQFANPKSYIVMTKDYTFACALDVPMVGLDKDHSILTKVHIRENAYYVGLFLLKENGMSPEEPEVHMLTDMFAKDVVDMLLKKL